MRLQLDSSALEYLLNHSSAEWKLELQGSVIQAFARRHLKALVEADLFKVVVKDLENFVKAAEERLRLEIVQTLGKVRKDGYGKLHLETVSSEVQSLIFEIVAEQKRAAVEELIATRSAGVTPERLRKMIDVEYMNQIRAVVREEILKEIQEKLRS
jgi:hypothetical protein